VVTCGTMARSPVGHETAHRNAWEVCDLQRTCVARAMRSSSRMRANQPPGRPQLRERLIALAAIGLTALLGCGGSGGPGDLGDGAATGTSGDGGSSTTTSGGDGGGAASIAAKDFDQTCTAATDCVAVLEGPACICACANAAISRSAQRAYQDQQSILNRECPKRTCAPPCKAPDLACENGKCVLH
jgi:hypothetical protein